MTASTDASAPHKRAPQSGAERQRRHRQHQKLHVLEVRDETFAQLRAICKRKRWTIKQAVAEGVKLLQEQLAAERRTAQMDKEYQHAVQEKAKLDRDYPLPPAKPRKAKPPPEEIEGQGSLLQNASRFL